MYSPKIWAALALAPLTAVGQQGTSATDQDEHTQLESITVTADPFTDRSPVEATQPTDVLSGEDLQRNRSNTLGESLANQPGVHSADFGAGSSRPVIRGLGGPRVRVLDGGSGVVDASTISPDHNVSTEPFRARQIEVLKGPASLLYGSGAIGGVINVVSDLVPTLPSEEWHGSIGFNGGTVDDARAYFGHVGGGNGKLAFHLDGLTRDTDDYRIPGYADSDGADEPDAIRGRVDNSATQTDSFGAGLSWTTEQGYLGLGWSTYDSEYGVPGHGHEDHEAPGADEDTHGDEGGVGIVLEQSRAELRGGYRPNAGPLERIRGSLVLSSYEHAEIEPEDPDAPPTEEHEGTVFGNDGQELRLELTHRPLGQWRGVFGIQDTRQDFSAVGEEAFVPPVDTTATGVFLLEERDFGSHRLSLGARLETVTHAAQANSNRDYQLLSLSSGMHFELPADQHLNVNLSRAQRAPDVQELYSDGPHLATASYERGNLQLNEETALNFDIGWSAQRGRLAFSTDLFYTAYSDFIYTTEVDQDGDGEPDFVHAEDGQLGSAEDPGELLLLEFTQADADFWGAEAQASLHLHGRAVISLFGDLVRAERADGGNLPRIPAARLGVGLDGEVGRWQYGVRASRVLKQDRTTPLESPTAAYTLLSADLVYWLPTPVGDLSFALRGRNLLDEEARNHVSVLKELAPLPGANLKFDVSLDF